jgi:hypothetical protein
MTIKQEVQIWQDVEVDVDIDEIYNNLSRYEKEDLLELLLQHRHTTDSNYYIEGLILGKSDSDILNNKKIWDNLIRLIKYEEPALKDYIIEELSYEPNTIGKEN